jgi:anti-sigma regulatory factor (Ser/Thr protein kinase)
MEMTALRISESSQVGEARREAQHAAERLGCDESAASNIAIAVTEAATNILKHAGGGELILRSLGKEEGEGLEVLALDRGPGMSSVKQCFTDGYSTGGGAGTGLGAMSRLASSFDIYSQPERGTALLLRFGKTAPPGRLQIGAVSVPKPGEEFNGDTWAVVHGERSELILLADGLGHGEDAEEASEAALKPFGRGNGREPAAILEEIHQALRPTRGAAAAVARLDLWKETLHFAGLGNIGGTVLSGGTSRSLVSMAGIAGHQARKVQEFTYPCPPGSLVVLHSDGLSTHFRLDSYPGLRERHAALIAGVLYRDFARGNDDVTVLVAKVPESASGSPQGPA